MPRARIPSTNSASVPGPSGVTYDRRLDEQAEISSGLFFELAPKLKLSHILLDIHLPTNSQRLHIHNMTLSGVHLMQLKLAKPVYRMRRPISQLPTVCCISTR